MKPGEEGKTGEPHCFFVLKKLKPKIKSKEEQIICECLLCFARK
jgi:hypothetical protein